MRLASRLRSLTILSLAVEPVSCHPRVVPVPRAVPAAARDACALAPDSTAIPDTLTLALPGTVDPAHAPVPRSEAEAMVFRQLYETLVRLDCDGAIEPGLAATWSVSDSGRRWTFALRAGAGFHDGEGLTARDVIASWMGGDTALLDGAHVEAPDDRTLVLRFASPPAGWPQRLADPALSVSRPLPGREWPVGTGPYGADTAGGRLIVAPLFGGQQRRPVLVVHALGNGDTRDWIDRGVDVLVTDDRAALSYATGRDDYAAVPLPWDRTYILLARGAAPELGAAARAGLARDALHVDARAATAESWWSALPACMGPPPAGAFPPAPVVQRRLLYARNDRAARELAERLVALQAGGAAAPLRAEGVGEEEFAAALASGQAAEYVVALRRASLDPCGDARALVARVPWLTAGAVIEPLVDTRRHAIVRRVAAAAFTVDWDGVLRVR